MSRVRVVQITHDLGIGGLPGVVTTLCKSLDRERFEVSVLCLNELGPLAEDLTDAGIPVRLLSTARRPDYWAALRAAAFFRRHRPAIVHTHNTQPLLDAGAGTILARTPALVHTEHGRMFPDKRRYMMAERCLSRFAHRVVCVSRFTAGQLVRYERIPEDRIAIVYNGIGSGDASGPDVAAGKVALGVPAEAPVLGVVARLNPEKGVRYALEAMPRVLRAVDDVHLLIVGYGPLEEELKALANGLEVADHVHFLGPRRDVAVLFRLFDIYVLPSVSEGLPLVILEAMAAGKPMVASRVGGVPEAVEDGRTGILVEPERPDRLADALIGLLSDRERRERFGAAARESFGTRFTAKVMAEQYEAIYDSALRSRGRGE